MAQHTPGPWKATEAEISTVERPSAIVAWLNVVKPKPTPSREIGCGGNWKANARLIASAPGLFAALVSLLPLAQAAIDAPSASSSTLRKEQKVLLATARTAIANATPSPRNTPRKEDRQ